jgi:adenylate kinase family enzyme
MTSVVCIIGPPGSGKSAVARALAEECGGHLISPSEWLRRVRDRPTPLGEFVSRNYNEADLDPLVTQYVSGRVALAIQEGEHAVVDDFPQTPYQVARLAILCRNRPLHVFHLHGVDSDEALTRIQRREYRTRTNKDVFKRRLEVWFRHWKDICGSLLAWKALTSVDAGGGRDIAQVTAHVVHLLRTADCLVNVVVEEQRNGGWLCESVVASPMHRSTLLSIAVHLSGAKCKSARFVGSHPYSVQRCHFELLRRYPYVISHKVDGVRSLLVVVYGRMFFIDRATVVRSTAFSRHLLPWNDTMLDVELLQQRRHCIVIDVLHTRRGPVYHQSIRERIHSIRDFMPMLADNFECGATVQRYYSFRDLRAAIELAPPQFPTDGICIVPADQPYRVRNERKSYKFKALEYNTIDLYHSDGKLFMSGDDGRSMLACGTLDNYVSWPSRSILECLPTSETTWRAKRTRTDKLRPNSSWVVRRILSSIEENITMDELIALAERRL